MGSDNTTETAKMMVEIKYDDHGYVKHPIIKFIKKLDLFNQVSAYLTSDALIEEPSYFEIEFEDRGEKSARMFTPTGIAFMNADKAEIRFFGILLQADGVTQQKVRGFWSYNDNEGYITKFIDELTPITAPTTEM